MGIRNNQWFVAWMAVAISVASVSPLWAAKGGNSGKPGGGDPPPEVRPDYIVPPVNMQVWPQIGGDIANSSRSLFLGPVVGVTTKWSCPGTNGNPVIDENGNLIAARGSQIICRGRDTGAVIWRIQLDRWDMVIPALGDNGEVYAAGFGSTQTGKVFAIDPTGTPDADGFLPPGSVVWTYESEIDAQCGYPRFVSDELGGIVYIGFTTGEVVALDANPTATQRLLWSTNIGFEPATTFHEFGALAVDFINNQSVVYAIGGYDLYALDGATGAVNWSIGLAKSVFPARHPTVGLDGTIYVSTPDDSSVRAINPDGSLKWRTRVKQAGYDKVFGFGDIGAIALDEYFDAETDDLRTTIYVGTALGVHALNGDGSGKWKWEQASRQVSAAPSVGADGTVYLHTNVQSDSATYDSTFALSPDGQLLWSAFVPNSPTTPVIDTVFDEEGNIVETVLYIGSGRSLTALTEP